MIATFRTVLFGLFAALLLAGAAQAHAVLQSASPTDGSLLETAPNSATLRFNEAVKPLSIRLVAPDGAETDLTDRVPGAAELAIPLPDLARGTHVLSWRVASDDGHPVFGALLFSVGEVTGAAPVAEGDPAVQAALWFARFLMTAGLALGVGGAAFSAFAGPVERARRPIMMAAVTGLVAAPLYLGLHGLDALGLGFAALVTSAPWATAWGPASGRASSWRWRLRFWRLLPCAGAGRHGSRCFCWGFPMPPAAMPVRQSLAG